MKLLALKNPRSTRRKYCTYRFKEEAETEELSIALCNRYNALVSGSDGEEIRWYGEGVERGSLGKK